jgi:glycosyltransferase involved in cell wall biosynthesis
MPTMDATEPRFSFVIPVFNDWEALDGCLRSLHEQTASRSFEVVIVDDGSRTPAPESIRQFSNCFPLTLARQPHGGIATARNCGVQNSTGTILVFTDADCRLDTSCLSFLDENIVRWPEHKYFQLRLGGTSSTLVGRAEELRLLAIQERCLQPDGCIRYLNTSGFAVRRSAIDAKTPLFDPSAQRSEDTLLLTKLIQKRELPFFVADAVVRHTLQLSIAQCVWKDLRLGRLEARTFKRIAATGVRMRMKNMQRFDMLRYMWNASRHPSIGRSAWFVLAARQALQRAISLVYACVPFQSRPRSAADSP